MSQSNIVQEAKEYVLHLLESCKDYPYHNPEHTIGVYERASYLGLQEELDTEDLQDIQIAALFHDTGFTVQYSKNEYYGAQLCRKWLESKNYPKDRIEKIEHIIMATVLFAKPHNLLEEIIQDADLDNIGTEKEFFYSQNYLREIRTQGHLEISDGAFWQFVYSLLNKYQFHTKTAKAERNEQKKKDIAHMEAFLMMIGCEVPKTNGLAEM